MAKSYVSDKADKLTIIDEELGAEEYGIAFRKGDDDVCKQVDDAIQKLVEDGTYEEIAKKYPDISLDNLIFLSDASK